MRLLVSTALALAIPVFGLAQSKDEAAVKAAHEAFVKAAKAGDKAALDKLLAPQLQYSHSSAKLENKQEAIAALAKDPVTFDIQSQSIHVYGNTATLRAKALAHGPTGDIPLIILQVWVKSGANWQLVERATTRIPAQ